MIYENVRAVLKDSKQIEYITSWLEPGEDDFIVKSKCLGVCSSDCKNYEYNNTHYFGHEIVGEVQTDYMGFKKGDYVAVFHKHGCLECSRCKLGYYHLCQNPRYMPIGFYKYLRIPKKGVDYCVYKVPKARYIDFVFLDSFSCVLHGVKSLKISKGKTILVIGTGFLSLLYAYILTTMGCRVHLFGTNKKKSKLASKLKNIDIKTSKEHLHMYDIFVETTGKSDLLYELSSYIHPKGQLLCFSNFNKALVMDKFRDNEISILFSKHTTKEDVLESIEYIARGDVPIGLMITPFDSLYDLETAINLTLSNDIIRGAINLD